MGFGGHARSVADLALACGYEKLLFVEQTARPNENLMGHCVVQSLDHLDDSWRYGFAASGDGRLRREQCEAIESRGLSLISLVSPIASVGVGSEISSGCFVGHHAHIGPLAKIGKACIVNTSAVVEHESRVGDYSHVSVNSSISGRSSLGSFSMLGAGGIIIDGISVADHVVVGAGAVVVASIGYPGTYIGVPARNIKNNKNIETA